MHAITTACHFYDWFLHVLSQIVLLLIVNSYLYHSFRLFHEVNFISTELVSFVVLVGCLLTLRFFTCFEIAVGRLTLRRRRVLFPLSLPLCPPP